MAAIKTEWKSTQPNPDEKHLKALWEQDIKSLERSVAAMNSESRRLQDNISPLLKATGLSQRNISDLLKTDADLSRSALNNAERQLSVSAIDFKNIHEQELKLAKANAEKTKSTGNPTWSGFLMKANYGGGWWSWNGESEEIPNVSFNVGSNRFDPRAQAWGEGWWDADFSTMYAYLAFTFTPPSWGHLHIYTAPWLHGYYSLYSNDAWYKGEYARAELDTWIDVHQNIWRPRNELRRFTMAGDELHPERSDRIDRQYGQSYYANIGESDLVTIRVGVRLYCRGKASGGRAKLNFQGGAANYVYIPYLYWYLHH